MDEFSKFIQNNNLIKEFTQMYLKPKNLFSEGIWKRKMIHASRE